jgi:hypothetical protein
MTGSGNDDCVKVERLGGLGGFGLPGSRIRSAGELALSRLSAAERKALDALFAHGARKAAVMPDGFRYRLTLTIGGNAKTIEAAEDQVPPAVRDCVKDTLA